ncbi:histone H2B subacrosomal variant [Ictidomys tridecemlineatus]|uniref:Histone H2B subacrosomal variant-like n=1 Tax=Ictidomys tridecemlineatus TaxID=43179 RepID=I3NCU9_ICTTR|nr:histone H2B subacrosomal variant-like [Ictidomys tridecemlineatus]KAG3266501.1 histone H2B subacrosomal variant-like [Ictidomys tridecemlineatus]
MARRTIHKYSYCKGHLSPISRKKSSSSTSLSHRNYSLYVNRVLKEVVPQRGMSSRTLDFMNTLINDIFDRIAKEAHHLMHFRKRCTLTPEDIQKAVYMLLPESLAKYAVTFGSEAVHRFVRS